MLSWIDKIISKFILQRLLQTQPILIRSQYSRIWPSVWYSICFNSWLLRCGEASLKGYWINISDTVPTRPKIFWLKPRKLSSENKYPTLSFVMSADLFFQLDDKEQLHINVFVFCCIWLLINQGHSIQHNMICFISCYTSVHTLCNATNWQEKWMYLSY